MSRWFSLFLLVALPGFAAARDSRPGQLCVGEADRFDSSRAKCSSFTTAKITIPVPSSRLFVIVTADRKRIIFGRLEAQTASIDVSNAAGVPMQLRFESLQKPWPAGAELLLESTPPARMEWRWIIPKEVAASMNSVEAPAGTYKATLSAPHFEPVTFKIDARRTGELGIVRLRPLAVLAGRVIARATRAPLAGAVIASNMGKTLAVTDLNGEFREELAADVNLTSINVSLEGYGTRSIVLDRTRGDRILPPVELDRGGSLRVRITRDMKKYPELSVEVLRVENRKQIHVGSAKLHASSGDWVVQDLDAGDFIVIASGEMPLQKLAKTATVKSGERATVDLEIEPIDLLGSVSRGSTKVAEAAVTLKSSQYGWSATVQTDDRGSFEHELWQSGRFAALVFAPGLTEPYLTASEISDTPMAHLDLVIPSGRIAGRVVDSVSQQPVAGAAVTLDSVSPEGTTRSLGATADEKGEFAFEGVARGRHSVTAEARSYIRSAQQSFVFEDDGESKQVAIALAPGDRFPLLVTTAAGTPIAGASVTQNSLLFSEAPATDGAGRVDVGIDSSRGALLMVIPKTGSFTLYRVPPGSDIPSEPVQVVVKPAAASITVTTLDDATSAPIRNVHILVRYNGEFIDPLLVRILAGIRGVGMTTDQRGQFAWLDLPDGTYDFWPYGSDSEAAEIMARRPPPSASLAVSSGAYSVKIRFNTRSANAVAGTARAAR